MTRDDVAGAVYTVLRSAYSGRATIGRTSTDVTAGVSVQRLHLALAFTGPVSTAGAWRFFVRFTFEEDEAADWQEPLRALVGTLGAHLADRGREVTCTGFARAQWQVRDVVTAALFALRELTSGGR